MLAFRRNWLPLLAFVLLAPGLALCGEIVGTYDCVGENVQGGKYTGTVAISKRGEAYLLIWTISGRRHQGIGILSDGVLAANWIMQQVGQGGVVLYKVEENGKLTGKWVGQGGGKICVEVLTPQRQVVRSDRPAALLAGQ